MTIPAHSSPATPTADAPQPGLFAPHRILALLTLLFVVSHLVIIWSLAPTYDEKTHRMYGALTLIGKPQRTALGFDSKSPVMALSAIPYGIGLVTEKLGGSSRIVAVLEDVRTARVPVALISLGLGFVVFFIARDFYGLGCGIFAFALYSLSPNILAHGSLCTTDMPFTAFAFAALTVFRKWLMAPGRRSAVIVSACLSLALLTKFTALLLPAAMIIYGVIYYLISDKAARTRLSMREVLALLLWMVGIFLVFANLIYSFTGSGTPLRSYHFRTSAFRALQRVPALAAIPLPLPVPFLDGFDMTKSNETSGRTCDDIYLFGEVRKYDRDRAIPPRPFAAYYLGIGFYKEAVAMIVLVALGLVYVAARKPFTTFVRNEGIFVVFVLLLLVFLSFFNSAQIGVRHALPMFVLFVILSAPAITLMAGFLPRFRPATFGLACTVMLLLTDARRFPDYVSYTNELAGGPVAAYQLMADSNLNWGQGDWIVGDFLRHNPDVVVNPERPVHGKRILIDSNSLAGIEYWRSGSYDWLRARKPVRHIGYTYLLFDPD